MSRVSRLGPNFVKAVIKYPGNTRAHNEFTALLVSAIPPCTPDHTVSQIHLAARQRLACPGYVLHLASNVQVARHNLL